MTSSYSYDSYPHTPGVIRKRAHPADVENSIRQILHRMGSPNPQSFTRRWPLEDVLEALTEVRIAMAECDDINNPAGMLWRILEKNERDKIESTNGG